MIKFLMKNWVTLFVILRIYMKSQSIGDRKNGNDDTLVFEGSLDLNEASVVL